MRLMMMCFFLACLLASFAANVHAIIVICVVSIERTSIIWVRMISQDIESSPLIMLIQYYGCDDCDSDVGWGDKRIGPVWMCSRYNLTHILADCYRYLVLCPRK